MSIPLWFHSPFFVRNGFNAFYYITYTKSNYTCSNLYLQDPTVFPLKGQCQEIFDPRFFHQTIPPRALIHGLKPIRKWLRIRRENRVGNRQNLMTPRDQTFWSEFPFNIYVSQ
jgi:hypothetical protein